MTIVVPYGYVGYEDFCLLGDEVMKDDVLEVTFVVAAFAALVGFWFITP